MATRLRRLKIERFRDLRPGTELFFNDGWNVLLGRNGSGKTTLLHLISMVLRDDLTPMLGEEFAMEYELIDSTAGTITVSARNSVRIKSRQSTTEFVPETRVELVDNHGHRFVYSWGQDHIHDSPGRSGADYGSRLRYPRLSASIDAESEVDPKASEIDTNLIDLLWNASMRRCYRIDEGLAAFESILGTDGEWPSTPEASVARFNVRDGMLSPIYSVSFVPDSVVRKMSERIEVTRPIVEVSLADSKELGRCVELLATKRVDIVSRRSTANIGSDELIEFSHFDFYMHLSGTKVVHHEHWSFGQQRLLTLFWYLACNPEVLVVDEPVNGLHWEWIEAFVESIGDRQVFVTAQNPLLLEHVGFDSAEKVQRSFVLCRRDARGEGEREMVWAQPNEEQAASFYRAWKTGVQPVHEVLKTEGLW